MSKKDKNSRIVVYEFSRDVKTPTLERRNGEMKSEKEPMTETRERSIVEIQFRDIQRDQESVTTSPKVKEEKKEVFTKVWSK